MGVHFTVEAIQGPDGTIYDRALVVDLAVHVRRVRREVLRQLAFHLGTLGLTPRPWLARLFVRGKRVVAPEPLPLTMLVNAAVHSPQIRDEVVRWLLAFGYLAPLRRSWIFRLFVRARALEAG